MKPTPIIPVITDTHLKKGNEELVIDIYKQFIKTILDRGLDTACFIGDFFTSREAQPLDVLDAAHQIFDMFQENGIELIGIPGNHDKVSLTSPRSYLDIFRDKFVLIRDLHNTTINGIDVGFIPYYKESIISNLQAKHKYKSKVDLCLTHLAINGVKNNDGSQVDDGLDTNMFKQAKLTLVGHYHNRSSLPHNIHYIGSAYQKDFGEDDKKGFVLVNSDLSLEYVQTKFPRYRKLVLNVNDSESIKELTKKKKIEENEFLRVELEGSKEELKSFNKDKLKDAGIDVKFAKQESRTDLQQEFVQFDRNNIVAYFNTFVEENGIQDIDTGLGYLKQVLRSR